MKTATWSPLQQTVDDGLWLPTAPCRRVGQHFGTAALPFVRTAVCKAVLKNSCCDSVGPGSVGIELVNPSFVQAMMTKLVSFVWPNVIISDIAELGRLISWVHVYNESSTLTRSDKRVTRCLVIVSYSYQQKVQPRNFNTTKVSKVYTTPKWRYGLLK